VIGLGAIFSAFDTSLRDKKEVQEVELVAAE
jgi:hypothetical protein